MFMAKADNHHPFSPQVTSEAHVTCGEGTWNIFTDYNNWAPLEPGAF